MKVLGLSCLYHDAAACIIEDGEILAAAQEERFTRKKHDAAFPRNSIAYCMQASGDKPIDAVAFYDKPITKFSRLISTYQAVGFTGLRAMLRAGPVWAREKLWVSYLIEKNLRDLGLDSLGDNIYFLEHHESHAASSFFPSPFEHAAILTMDAVGEWATTSVGVGKGNEIHSLEELHFPHSLGMLYSSFTYFCGFKVNSGEYKLMGLAPYGEPTYVDTIRKHIVDIRPDGSFQLNMKYFDYLGGLQMTSRAFAKLFGGPARSPESRITRRELDLAASVQAVTEEIVLATARHLRALTGETKLCLSGGVALNCVANGKLKQAGIFDEIWVQPAAGDAGGAVGSALYVWYQVQGNKRNPDARDSMKRGYLGPSFGSDELRTFLDKNEYRYTHVPDRLEWATKIAELMVDQHIIGLFVGRMEFGPRALGHRSIIGDPRSSKMQSVMNIKIKMRESFRPFAPIVLAERTSDYFDFSGESPYMLMVASVAEALRKPPSGRRSEDLTEWVNEVRSDIPAVTHVDYSARLQTITEENPELYAILKAFERLTGCGVLINTSFNVRGEPIVCTPEDAYRCFMRTSMDYLVLEDYILAKSDQPKFVEDEEWKTVHTLD